MIYHIDCAKRNILKELFCNIISKDKFEGQILHKQSEILNIINAQTNATFSLKGYFHKHLVLSQNFHPFNVVVK